MSKKLIGSAALILAGALAFSACGTPNKEGDGGTPTKNETAVSVMWNQPFYTYNTSSTFGNATANANIVYLTSSAFAYYDKDLKYTKDESFGKYEKVSDSPLTIKLTLSDKAKWSDGTPVTAADMILTYGAVSGLYNNLSDDEVEKVTDPDTGEVKKSDGEKVYFDSSSPSLQLITKFPEVGDNGKSITYTYDKPYADWELGLIGPGLPAHIVGKRALGEADAAKASQAVIDAFKNKDNASLSKIANVWNNDWNFVSLPAEKDKDLLVTNGAYTITDYKEGQYLTVSKNAKFEGDHKASIDKITIRYNEDPNAAVSALKNNEVQIISPQSTADVLAAVKGLPNVKFETGDEGTYEHVDLTMNNGGPFDPKTYGGDAEKARKVREAFLYTIPREEIITKLIKPLNPEAKIRESFNAVPGSPNYDDVVTANGQAAKYAKVDIEKAKALLKEAGVTAKPKVRLLYAKKNVRRQQEFALIKASADQAGFEVIDNGNDDWGKKLGDKTYDASLFGWQSTSTAVTESQANFIKGGNNNYGGYVNADVDKWYSELMVETDPAKQKALNEQIEAQLVKDAFGITIFQFPGIIAYSDTVEGVSKITLSPTIFWNFWEWKVK